MAERKPRFVIEEGDASLDAIVDTESLLNPKTGEVVAVAAGKAWARIIADALNRTTQ